MRNAEGGQSLVTDHRLLVTHCRKKSAFAMLPGRTLEYEFTVKGDVLTLVQKPSGPGLKFVRLE